eukprot:898638-Rhodomonas_salina.1
MPLQHVDVTGVKRGRYEVQKFQREAYLLRSLLHPGVLRVYGFCKTDYVLVTEVRPSLDRLHHVRM